MEFGDFKLHQLVSSAIRRLNQGITCSLNAHSLWRSGKHSHARLAALRSAPGLSSLTTCNADPAPNQRGYWGLLLGRHRSTSPGMKGITAYIGTAFEHRTRSRHQRLPSSKTNSQASGTPIQLSPPRCSNSGLLTNVRAPSSEPTTLHSVPSTHPPPYFHFGLMPLLNFVLGCAHKTARWA